MLIRIDVNDFNRIYEIIKLSFPVYRVKDLEEYQSYFKDDKYQCFVFISEGKELGFATGYVFQDDDSKFYPKKYGYFHMDYLCVYEEYRNQGYGTKLMKELLNESFTRKGLFFVLPFENSYKDDESDPYFEKIGDDPYIMAKRFFDQFSQIEIAHYQNDKEFIYMYPGSDNQLHPMHLHLIKGFHKENEKDFKIFYDEFAELLKESEDFIHQNNPLREKAYETYKDTIIKTTYPYYISANYYELKNIDVNNDRELLETKSFVTSGDETLRANLFNGGYCSLETCKAMLVSDTILNEKNILALYLGDNGFLYRLSQLVVFLDEYPENNREELLKAYRETEVEVPEGFDKALEYLGKFKNKMKEGERRILFVSKGTSYYSSTINEGNLLTKLPKGKTYVIEIDKNDTYRIMDYTKLGFKVRKEYEDTVELFKKM